MTIYLLDGPRNGETHTIKCYPSRVIAFPRPMPVINEVSSYRDLKNDVDYYRETDSFNATGIPIYRHDPEISAK